MSKTQRATREPGKKKRVSQRDALAKITALRVRWEIGPTVLAEFQQAFSHDSVSGWNVASTYIGFTLGLEAAERALKADKRPTPRETLYKMVYHKESHEK